MLLLDLARADISLIFCRKYDKKNGKIQSPLRMKRKGMGDKQVIIERGEVVQKISPHS